MESSLISFETTDGLVMKGFLSRARENVATVIHVHGNCGNFYENPFIPVFAQVYGSIGVNFLSVNNRGHDVLAEVYRKGSLEYIGGATELLEESAFDIEGSIRFAEQELHAPIILQGHSFGCLKVLNYIVQRRPLDFILLSPADTYDLQSNNIRPETIQKQLVRLREEYATDLNAILPGSEFGIRQERTQYRIPITAKSLLSLLTSPSLNLLRYKMGAAYALDARAFIYYGGADGLWTVDFQTVQDFFNSRISHTHYCYLEQGDHHFHGFEQRVATEISRWLLTTTGS